MLPGRLFGELHSPPRIGRRATRKRGAYAKSLASSSWSRRASLGSVRVLGLDAPQKLKEVKTWRLSPPGVGWGVAGKNPFCSGPRCQRTALPHSRPSVSFARDKPPQRKLNAEISHAVESCQVISRHLIGIGGFSGATRCGPRAKIRLASLLRRRASRGLCGRDLQGCKVFAAV